MTAEIGPPRPPTSSNSVVGRARQIRRQTAPYRGNPGAHQLLTFRLEITDKDGNPRPPVGVEIRAADIRGNLEDGDWIELNKGLDRHGRVTECINLSTGQMISVKRYLLGQAR